MKSLQKSKKLALTTLAATSILAGSMVSNAAYACTSQPFIGSLCAFGGNFAIRDWAVADGTTLSIASHTALFSLLGTTFGGDGRTTFNLPDLRGRAAIGVGNGPALSSVRWGEKSGSEMVTLNVTQLPSHNHIATTTVVLNVDEDDVTVTANLVAQNTAGSSTAPTGNMLAQNGGNQVYSNSAPAVAMAADAISASANATVNASATTTLGNTGGNQPHENRMPYIAINWLIALQGIYPSRS